MNIPRSLGLSWLCLLCCVSALADTNDLTTQMLLLNQQPIATNSNLWLRLRQGFGLNHQSTQEVKYWEKRYSNPKYFNLIMQNAQPYLYFVVSELERRGLPTELALIPIVESTYNPNAVSPAAISTGMWQFVSSTGRRFGMLQNQDLDERKDIVKSTRAAISYLQYLHDLFGSWELAIAAYNWGEGNINNAINKAGSTNFYALDVRDVTRQYLPKVIALANIISNPQHFGIKLSQLPNQPYFAIVKPTTPISLSQFMAQTKLEPGLNLKLNPQYNSLNYLVNPSQRLLLPMANQANYLATAPAPPAADPINQLASADSIAPTESQTRQTTQDTINDLLADTTPSASFINYTVVAGDTLYSVAKKFDLPIATIVADNQLLDQTLKLNQKLRIRHSTTNS